MDEDVSEMNPQNSKLKRIKLHLEKIEDELKKTIESPLPNLARLSQYSLFGEGKRLRPLLFVLSAQLCNYSKEDIYRLSILFELVHAGSLLHDDVLDNAEIRRKKPATRNIWGNAAAVLGGDFFYASATAIATESKKWPFIAKLADASVHMVEGQFLELEQTNNWQITRKQYFEIIQSKTAELISAACVCGAFMADAQALDVDRLNQFGFYFGVAFQMQDDLLDYISSEEVFGKPVGNDIKEGKVTLPLIETLKLLNWKEVEKIGRLFKKQPMPPDDYARIIEMVRTHSGVAKVQSEIREYLAKAASYLETFPPCPAKEDLLVLNHEMADRLY